MSRATIRPPSLRDEAEFLARVAGSRRLHRPWVHPPADHDAFRRYVRGKRSDRHVRYLVCEAATKEIAGVVNASEIVRGVFHSAYLGFYAFRSFEGRGLMSDGLRLVLRDLFGRERLHRVEANIQPENERSKALVKRLGFRLEGLSPRYLKIGGRWRDHERWALLAEEWSGAGRRRGARLQRGGAPRGRRARAHVSRTLRSAGTVVVWAIYLTSIGARVSGIVS